MKRAVAIIVGTLVGIFVIYFLILLAQGFYASDELDMEKMQGLRSFVRDSPLGFKMIVIVAWAIGSFLAGLAASHLCPNENEQNVPYIVGGILMLLGIISLIDFKFPIWAWIPGLLVFLPSSYIGAKIAGYQGQ